ncbi:MULTISPECIES: sulfurtransferase TusA [unclassified Oceanobacter]|uniref:sulfurtransferase TusA n=1 Tax=unclassified Oceanobacter TaxID=2620260 RepID=UPI002734E3A7|nr:MULTISPECIES: sulfurtransferase TusA [unclassified Oceanobacter]MDP2506199.1 sulfurtransferase TusA [Oceanobacter sp. 3_MG-2023]MDP2547260.1 sulfurtransferase TusA [Oceanobacter sp. 4_MG-2023]
MSSSDTTPHLPIQHQLDTRGLFCPEPVMMLHNLMNDAALGDCIEVLATDPSTQRDFTRFCGFLEQEMLLQEDLDGVYRFIIRKVSDTA